ncbi:MAG: GAF and ANTAR domain-containing protein [Acidimicrobiia bacterium]
MARTMVQLADTLVDDFDVVELLTLLTRRCVDFLGASAAGVQLAEPGGDLRALASSSEAAWDLEQWAVRAREGPGPDAWRSGQPVVNVEVGPRSSRWPGFGPMAFAAGFRRCTGLPMQRISHTIGAVSLFHEDETGLDPGDLPSARAMADVTTIAILQHRAVNDAQVVAEQLRRALDSRVAIEQAKGMLAGLAGIGVEHAFRRLRSYARSHNAQLAQVAEDFVHGRLGPDDLDDAGPAPGG